MRRVTKLLVLLSLAAGSVMGQATTNTTNEQVPFNSVIVNECLGEPVALTGTLHIVNHVTFSPSGNFSLESHFQPQGITGTGLVTGTKWNATGVTRQSVHSDAPLPFVVSYVNNFRIIGQGQAGNYTVHVTQHTTVNANGTTTSTVDNIKIECR